MKRYLSLVVLTALLLSLYGCQNGRDAQNPPIVKQESASEETNPAGTETDEPAVALPEMDWDGRAFHVLGMAVLGGYEQFKNFEICTDEQTGDVVNDAVFNRNLLLADTCNVQITESLFEDPQKELKRAVSTGERTYDASFQMIQSIQALTAFGCFADLNSLPYFDFDKPWWDHNAIDGMTVDGRLYVTTSDFNLRDKSRVYILCYNNELASAHQLDDLVPLVRDGKWTIDAMTQYCTVFASDVDGNGKMEIAYDNYGIGADSGTVVGTLFFALENRIVETDADGRFTLVMQTERAVDSIDKILKLFEPQIGYFSNDTVGKVSYDPTYTFYYKFRDGQQLFFTAFPHMLRNASADCEFIYTILPMPKYDEAQTEYLSIVDFSLGMLFGVPSICEDSSFSAFMLEALSHASRSTTRRAYYDTTCKCKYSYNEDSAEMLDLIFGNLIYDYGFITNIGNLSSILVGEIPVQKRNVLTSSYKGKEKSAQRALDNLYTTPES